MKLCVDFLSRKASHPVHFYEDFASLKDYLAPYYEGNTVFVTDENVYAKVIAPSFKEIPKDNLLILPAGESTKSLIYAQKVYAFLEKNLDRLGQVIAIGGGVILDLVGFVSSTFLRGVSFVNVPTSLLAMVDASVGGKTGINTPFGKNRVGTFALPDSVLICQGFLKTLPDIEQENGLAEMIKHGIISSKDHFNAVKNVIQEKAFPSLSLIYDSVKIKKEIVEKDPYEKNIRGHLNLGHTFAHAIESISAYKIPHGQAVAMGVKLATEKAEKQNIIDGDIAKEIYAALAGFSFSTTCPYNETEMLKIMQNDKKNEKGEIRYVLPEKIGQVAFFSSKT